jgi:hypothetical protein
MNQQAQAQGGSRSGADDVGIPWLAPLLPEQVLGRPRRTPEQRLMVALLEDAVRELVRPEVAWMGAAARRRAEVWSWVESDDVAWPFSFLNVCDALDLDAEKLRARLTGRRLGRGLEPARR